MEEDDDFYGGGGEMQEEHTEIPEAEVKEESMDVADDVDEEEDSEDVCGINLDSRCIWLLTSTQDIQIVLEKPEGQKAEPP